MRIVTVILAAFAVAIPVQASLQNADMENQPGAEFASCENWNFGMGGGWTTHASYPAANNGTLGEKFGFYSANLDQIMGQVSSLTFAPDTTYVFTSWAVGGGNDTGKLPYQIGYLEGGTSIGADFVALATNIMDLDGQGQWLPQAGVSYTTGSGGPEMGREVVVRFGGVNQGGDSDVWVDNVSLTPEPASLLLLGLGGLLLARRRR